MSQYVETIFHLLLVSFPSKLFGRCPVKTMLKVLSLSPFCLVHVVLQGVHRD